VHNCAPYHFPLVDNQIDTSLVVVFAKLHCMLCEQFIRATTMFVCDQCSRGWHMGCFTPPLGKILVNKWFYPHWTQVD
jgi:hypothetical protein